MTSLTLSVILALISALLLVFKIDGWGWFLLFAFISFIAHIEKDN